MYDVERFGRLLRRDFLPILRVQGFEVCDGVFRRIEGERIDIVSLRGSRRGRRCCVELGVHYRFLPPSGRPEGVEAADGRLRLHDCVFRQRLCEGGRSECWWDYGSDDATTEASVASLVKTYERRAHLFFAAFDPSPEDLAVPR